MNHVLPEDLAAGAQGDVSWFERCSPFVQAETRRQVEYKRRAWPEMPSGERSKDLGKHYPHILPADGWSLSLYEPIREAVIEYVRANDIELHSDVANLRSSQICCFNFLFPLRLQLKFAAVVLKPLLPHVTEVLSIEFEDVGEDGSAAWLGETGGKRGQNRTSMDAAVRWRDHEQSRRLTLIEWKYTEPSYGDCGGFKSKGNPDKQRCRSLDVRKDPAAQCFLALPGRHGGRRYWEHLGPETLDRLANADGCPFQGPLYQLLRQELLARHHRVTGGFNSVDVVAIHFGRNEALAQVPRHLKSLGTSVGA